MQAGLVELFGFRSRSTLFHFQADALIAEQHEVMDEDLGCFLQRVLRRDATVGSHLDGELLVVGLLLHTRVLHRVLHVLDRREDAVDRDGSDGCVLRLVLVGRNVTTAFAHGEFHVQFHARLHVCDHQFWVQHLETGGVLADVACGEAVFTGHGEGDLLGAHIIQLAAETHLLQVQHDLGHVLDHTLDGAELVVHAVDTYGGDGMAFEAAEQDTAKGVADGDTVARLQRAELEGTALIIGFDHRDLVGPLEFENGHVCLVVVRWVGLSSSSMLAPKASYLLYNSTMSCSRMVSGI